MNPPQSGTYRIKVGKTFYIGSSSDLPRRLEAHKSELKTGRHANAKLQEAFNNCQLFELEVIKAIPRKLDESDRDFRRRLKLQEQILLDDNKGNPNLANTSESAFWNSKVGDNFRAKWQDPEFRAAQVNRLKARKGSAITAETRSKMAEAKRGGNNVKARACQTTFNGITTDFPCVTSAAAYHGTTQQAMDAWMAGKTPWPGQGKKPPRPHLRHLIGLTGCYK